ncbi:hypothetical protein OGATHE_005473 [Ogataea polymorpha]|uniref:Uncharacterized protein n=1 Tax=Ogataea polymorpha TaxID=460523 RepID=A0A9P8NWP7_9ASCO|nr:hypothetical protein OGATHE_005473 [Ogataea polymorpha]
MLELVHRSGIVNGVHAGGADVEALVDFDSFLCADGEHSCEIVAIVSTIAEGVTVEAADDEEVEDETDEVVELAVELVVELAVELEDEVVVDEEDDEDDDSVVELAASASAAGDGDVTLESSVVVTEELELVELELVDVFSTLTDPTRSSSSEVVVLDASVVASVVAGADELLDDTEVRDTDTDESWLELVEVLEMLVSVGTGLLVCVSLATESLVRLATVVGSLATTVVVG